MAHAVPGRLSLYSTQSHQYRTGSVKFQEKILGIVGLTERTIPNPFTTRHTFIPCKVQQNIETSVLIDQVGTGMRRTELSC